VNILEPNQFEEPHDGGRRPRGLRLYPAREAQSPFAN
jgi:hypothetical protein